ncbi:MAG: hypothetical protein AAF570_25315, partial [Bacteroidota bacterium]
ISYADFHNILTLALDFRDLDWARQFVERYSLILLPELQEKSRRMAFARIEFVKGDFRKALKGLNKKVSHSGAIDQMLERILRIQCHFELEEFDHLEYLLESSRKQADRFKDAGSSIQPPFQKFVRMTRMIMRARLNVGLQSAQSKVLEALRGDIRAFANEWLEEKASELSESE